MVSTKLDLNSCRHRNITIIGGFTCTNDRTHKDHSTDIALQCVDCGKWSSQMRIVNNSSIIETFTNSQDNYIRFGMCEDCTYNEWPEDV